MNFNNFKDIVVLVRKVPKWERIFGRKYIKILSNSFDTAYDKDAQLYYCYNSSHTKFALKSFYSDEKSTQRASKAKKLRSNRFIRGK